MILQNCKINGKIDAKPSKSIFQRLIALSLLSQGPTTIQNPSICKDSLTSLNLIKSVGCRVVNLDNQIMILPNIENKDLILNCNESALAIRMFAPVLSLLKNKYTLIAKKTLKRRKLFEIESILTSLGAKIKTKNGFPPITVQGPINSGKIMLDGSYTSQFLSGLLMALPKLNEKSEIVVKSLSSQHYVEITLQIISQFGGYIERTNENSFICHPSNYCGGSYYCENDWSNAAVFLIAGAIGGKCEVSGLDLNSKQGDKVIIEILKSVGAEIDISQNSIIIGKKNLKSFEFDAKNNPDLVPALSALALNCEGKSYIYNVDRLKYKEINRLEKIIKIFKDNNLGIEYENDCLIIKGNKYNIEIINSDGDHRFAMVGALLSINNPIPIQVLNHQAVNKSYPEFWNDFRMIQKC